MSEQSSWRNIQVRHLSRNLDYLRVPLNSTERAEVEGRIPYWGANSIVGYVKESLVSGPIVLIGEDGAPFFDPFRPVAFAIDGSIWPNNHVHVLRPKPWVDYRFLAHALNCVDYRVHIKGSTRDKLNQSDLSAIALRIPKFEEQVLIADYLDHETAEIDALISDLFSAIGLAEERLESFRTGLLQSAGNACHRRLKTLADVTVGIVVRPSDWYAEAGVPALRGVNVKREFIALDDLVHITEAGHRLHPKSILKPGDVVVVRTGQAGAAAVVDASLTDCNAIDLLIIKRGALLDPSFLAAFINSEPIRESVKSGTVGAIQGHFNVEALRNLEVPNLPLTKQVELVAAWHHERKLVSAMSADLTSAIALAKERRAALITAAVTGQIDVTATHRPAAEQLEDDIKELT